MDRKLATVEAIDNISPIENADLIEVATVKGWKLVIKKGEFQRLDKAVYCEIDSFLPIKEEFEFLRKSSFRKMGELEGFRLKTIKLRGQISQGLLLPLSLLPKGNYEIGKDVSSLLGIVKYEPPIPAQLSGKIKGFFPSFMNKTDEERIQNLTDAYDNYKKNTFYITEKLDGSSATFYFNNGVFGVCSRNLDLLETPDNSFWKAARDIGIEEKLSELGNFALQGELVGEGIQGNPYKIKGQKVYFFNAFNIDQQRYLEYGEFIALMALYGLPSVPIISVDYRLPESIEELLIQAEGKSIINKNTDREGFVIRSHNRNISFKVISNTFLLKEK